jgi:hypothetical protein
VLFTAALSGAPHGRFSPSSTQPTMIELQPDGLLSSERSLP